jgi:ABC-type Na+ efflux pump permease subunit
MKKILIIMQKEWLDMRGQRFLWLSFLLFPLVMVLATGSALVSQGSGGGIHSQTPNITSDPTLASMTPEQIAQAVQAAASRTVFFMIPFVIPTILAGPTVWPAKRSAAR